jgi:hypothetical protein
MILIHYWADMAGMIIGTWIPLLVALGMKNNIISNMYHGHPQQAILSACSGSDYPGPNVSKGHSTP